MKLTSCLLILTSSLLSISCRTTSERPQSDAKAIASSPDRSTLTQIEASARAEVIRSVRYDLGINIDPTVDLFQGTVRISFDLVSVPKTLFLDFRNGAEIAAFSVNGFPAKADGQNGRLALPTGQLKAGKNIVEISYRQAYSNDGTGFYRFRDPEDGRLYHYTQFETFDANHLFPCFDQPDLKAKLKLAVTAPADWQVVTATSEASVSVQQGRKSWVFKETPSLSTYLFSLHAGPYREWKSTAGRVPMRLFARRSMAKYVEPEAFFQPVRRGLPYFGSFFARAYPFEKYDQLVVPDFNTGAMENVAAVTFSERYLRRSAMTVEDRDQLAETVLHELAHMWFGNLVTMRWWNGLWLNESFASYMAAKASSEALGKKGAWRDFHDGMKRWAYWEDRLVTTHPIEGRVPDTASAFATFDGITYGKGASVLRQLEFSIGERAFRKGLRLYFKKHAYGNTEISDFISALEIASSRSLTSWSHAWLRTSGVDTIEAQYACEAGRVRSFSVMAEPPNGGSVRPHRTSVGLLDRSGKTLKLRRTTAVSYGGGKTSVPAFVGERCPDFVDLNVGDHDYVHIRLDRRSLETVVSEGLLPKDDLARTMLWGNLFNMVHEASLPAGPYLSAATKSFLAEKDLKIGSELIESLVGREGHGSALEFLPRSNDIQKNEVEQKTRSIEQALWTKIDKMSSRDWKMTALRGAIDATRTRAGANHLWQILTQKTDPLHRLLDQDLRWAAIIRLSSLGHPRSAELIQEEAGRDPSERGQQAALAAQAAAPRLAIKRDWLNRLTASEPMTLARARTVLRSFLPTWQDELRAALAPRFFAELPELVRTRDEGFVAIYARFLAPAACTRETSEGLASFIAQDGARLTPNARKSVRIALQENDRCIRARATTSPEEKK